MVAEKRLITKDCSVFGDCIVRQESSVIKQYSVIKNCSFTKDRSVTKAVCLPRTCEEKHVPIHITAFFLTMTFHLA